MKYSVKKINEKNDIFKKEEFIIENFFHLEINKENNEFFRWSNFNFKIIPLILRNKSVCINFNALTSRKITVLIENKIRIIKKEIDIENDKEYILCISFDEGDIFSFFVDPYIPDRDKDGRILGLFIKNIFYTDTQISSVQLFEKNDVEVSDQMIIEKKCLYYHNNDCEEENSNPNIEILPFKYNKNNFYFNSSIFEHKNEKFIVVRHCFFVLKNISINKLKIFNLKECKDIKFDVINEHIDEQYEDPRILFHNNKFYISCSCYIHGNYKQIHQKILIVDDNLNHIGNIHPKYGNNGESILNCKGIEKNWTYFVYENRLMCIYKINPHIVVEFDWDGNLISEYTSHNNINSSWKFGECRGGTNPIYKNGYYHSFFHSNLISENGIKKYYMGYYKFEAKPPFNIVYSTDIPIMCGKEYDERLMANFNHSVVFPMGIIDNGDEFIVSVGLNDEKTALLKISNKL